jgi:hypothetical protein
MSFSSLETFLSETLTQAKLNREVIDRKWERNYAAVEVDPDYDGRTWKKKERAKSWKSDTIFDITRQKVGSAKNLTTDILFKGGRIPFMLSVDERVVPPSPDGTEAASATTAAVDANEDLMDRQFRHVDTVKSMTHLLLDGAAYGEYVAKSYVTDITEEYFAEVFPGVFEKKHTLIATKAIERKSLWNIWRDLETPDIRKGAYIYEREMVSADDLDDLKGLPMYNDAAIQRAIDASNSVNSSGASSETATNTANTAPGQRRLSKRLKNIEKFEFWGRVPVKALAEFELKWNTEMKIAAAPAIDESDTKKVEAFVIFIGNEIVAYKRAPGPRPYFREEWDLSHDGTNGRGVADALEYIQRDLTGAVRSFNNNAKLLSNFIVAVRRRFLLNKPEDVIDEGGVIELSDQCENVEQGFKQVPFTNILGPLIQAIDMFMEFADLSSNLPRAEQGQQSDNPQTAFELQQRLEKSGKYLAEVIRRFDALIEWAAKELYEYNMNNPDLDVQKIPAIVKPLGFTSFENRFLRLQKLIQVLTMALNSPELSQHTNVRWLWEEILKALDIEPDQAMKSVTPPATVEAPPPPPPDPAKQAVDVAKADSLHANAEKQRVTSAIALEKAHAEAAGNQKAIEQTPLGGLQMPG